jgi:hypothetical protein
VRDRSVAILSITEKKPAHYVLAHASVEPGSANLAHPESGHAPFYEELDCFDRELAAFISDVSWVVRRLSRWMSLSVRCYLTIRLVRSATTTSVANLTLVRSTTCASYLVLKWSREVLITFPRARAFVIYDMRNGGDPTRPHGIVEVQLKDGRTVNKGLKPPRLQTCHYKF